MIKSTITLLFCSIAMMLTACSEKAPDTTQAEPTKAEKTPIKIQLNWFAETEHGGYFHAQLKGLYEAKGLDVEIINGGPNTPVESLVAVGDRDFGIVNADKILAVRQNGLKIVGLMAPYQITPRCVLVHADGPFKSFEDIKNTTFVANNTKPFYKFLVHKYGLEGIKTIPYRGGPAQFMANKEFAIQGYVNSEPLAFARSENKTQTRILRLADAGFNPYTSVLVTSEKMLQEKPDLVASVVQASQQGWLAYLADPTVGNAEIQKRNPEMDAELLNESAAALNGLMLTDESHQTFGIMTVQRWNTLAATLVECGALKTAPENVESAFNVTFLKSTAPPSSTGD